MAVSYSKLRIEASLVICPLDGFTGEVCRRGKLSLSLDDQARRPVFKPDGYYVFTNLSGGEWCLTVRSDIFFEETQTVDRYNLDGPERVFYVSLKPRAHYPFPEGTALIRGSVRDRDGRPVRGMKVRAVPLSENCTRARVSREGCTRGSTEIGLVNVNGIIAVNDVLLLKAKGGSESESVQIAGVLPEEGRYRLAQPLESEWAAKTLLFPVVETRTDERGELVVYFRGMNWGNCKVRLELFDREKVWEQEMEIEEGKTTNLGVVTI